MPEPGAVTLRARNVSAKRGDRTVLEGIDFPVIAGQIVALVGPNGAGKSTLLAALAGELELSGGSVELDGHALTHWTHLDMARRRAVLPQSHTVGFPFRAREVVAMGRSPWAHTDRQDRDDEAIAAAMAATDVERFAARPFPALSGGERARVALARVLAQDTATLLLDEPTAALDLGHQEQVLHLARERAAAGAAVVVVLHDLGVAAAYADRVAVLEAGRIAADGPPRQILTPQLLSRVYQHPVDVFDHPVTGAQLVLPVRG
ncbi:heme ABC transporter ATP-binding protein [Nocardia sp. CA-151230]|uniref:heme ABC transporter ATP-binding protein n=1 Tax=Nocardia sp. CA-151230 TaxID=3239982 RepID=UPI003D8B2B13